MEIPFVTTEKTAQEMLNTLEYFSLDDIFQICMLVILVIIVILFIYYIFPIVHVFRDELRKKRAKLKRKSMVQQIALQKEIEEEIEKNF